MDFIDLYRVLEIRNGYAFKSEEFRDSGIPLVRISNIESGTVNINGTTIRIDESYLSTKPDFIVEKGDIVIALSGATTGKYGIYNYDFPSLLNQRIGLIKAGKSKKIESRYFFYYLSIIQKDIFRKAFGAAQPNISTKEIGRFKIPLPPLSTQQQIARILDQADDLRKKTQQVIDLYEQLAQSLFLDMFGDPVRNPKGWELVRIKEITVKIGSGATPRGGKESYLSEGISLIRSLNVHDGLFKMKDLAHISEKQANKLNNVTVEEEDVLLNITGASVCRCTIVPASVLPARVNQHVAILRCEKRILNPFFLLYTLVSENSKKKLLSIALKGGATREALTKEDIEKYIIPIPPLTLQNQFAEKISLIEKQKELAKQSLQESENLFNALLQKAFKGELVNSV